MYFDADEGVFVYLKNVRVADPRFSLTGANELKIFLAKKPEETSAKKPDRTRNPAWASARNSAMSNASSPPARCASSRSSPRQARSRSKPAARFSPIISETGEIVLTGGYPWVKQGTSFMRANEPNLSLRIQKNGSFVTEGNWDMGGNLDQDR